MSRDEAYGRALVLLAGGAGAAQGLRYNIIPQGFTLAITTQELLALADEWERS